MKTTELINGKTFDEVFAERGKETTIDKMVIGNIYFFEMNGYDWNLLSIFARLNDLNEHPASEIGTIHDLFSDGYEGCIDDICEVRDFNRKEVTSVYEATPNQIELLNMYINHEK